MINEAPRNITLEILINMESWSIKISNYIMNEIQNCQTTVGFRGKPQIEPTKNSQNLIANLMRIETTSTKKLIM